MDALKSPFTKESYGNSFRRYLEYHKLKSPDDLLIHAANPHYIESQIIDYVNHLRKNGIAYASIEFYVAPVFTFYQLNDVVLNRKKISRYYGEYKRVAIDEAYTTEQIQQMLQNADQRMRMIILLLSSTAARIGSLPALTLGNLTKLPDYGLYKIVFYDGTSSEYYNFCTRECASTGIDHTL
jgi:integrase